MLVVVACKVRERERERERDSKYNCNLFLLVFTMGFVGWWWGRTVVCVAVAAACRGIERE